MTQAIVQQQQAQPPAATEKITVRSLLGGAKMAELQKVAGVAMSAERLIKMFAIAASRLPKLLHCEPLTMLDCMVKCAELRLMPGTLGSVYLIPYENHKNGTIECQFMLGYRGMMTLARRSKLISTLTAEVVRHGDAFEFEYGIDTKFVHRPLAPAEARITHAWALAKFHDGAHQLCVMTRAEIDAIRSRSSAGQNGPWVRDFAEMAKKTAIRRLCKYLPLEPDIEAAISEVDKAEIDLPEMGSDADMEPSAQTHGSRADALAAKHGKPVENEATKEKLASIEQKRQQAQGNNPVSNGTGNAPDSAPATDATPLAAAGTSGPAQAPREPGADEDVDDEAPAPAKPKGIGDANAEPPADYDDTTPKKPTTPRTRGSK